jgi:predicted DNA-binding transcriptional regulator YafY
MISDVIDIFGKEVKFEKETNTHVIVSAKVNEESMIRFAQSCAPDVVILEPENMVERMRKWSESVKEAYGR